MEKRTFPIRKTAEFKAYGRGHVYKIEINGESESVRLAMINTDMQIA